MQALGRVGRYAANCRRFTLPGAKDERVGALSAEILKRISVFEKRINDSIAAQERKQRANKGAQAQAVSPAESAQEGPVVSPSDQRVQ